MSEGQNNRQTVMVCVTRQKNCARLIRAGRDIAHTQQAELAVVHVIGPQDDYLGVSKQGDVLEELFQIAQEANATMMVLRSDDVIATLADQALTLGATHMVIGESRDDGEFLRVLRNRVPFLKIVIEPA